MYKYKNSFKNYDEAKYPYGMEFIKESKYDNFHGECTEEGFNIMAGGSKHLFATPALENFDIKMKVTLSHYRAPFRNLVFAVLAGFDKKTRKCYDIEFKYEYNERIFSISIVESIGLKKTVLLTKKYEDTDIKYHTPTPLKVSVSDGKVQGSFGKYSFDFDFVIPRGRVGIDVSYVSYGIIFSDATVTSAENFEKKKVFSQKFNLPNINGAVRPYQIAIDLYHISGSAYEMKYKLTGGANSIPERNIHSNVWSLPFDDITDMYIKTVEGNKTKKYYLFNGTKRFTDPNMRVVFHDFHKQVFDMETVPFTGSFCITDFPENSLIAIGYEHLSAKADMAMEGASDHIFDNQGNLLYSGEQLEKDAIVRMHSVDKKIIKKLPKTLWHYEDAVRHAERNHYFYTDEVPKFNLSVITKFPVEDISVKVTLLDAFFTKIKDIKVEKAVAEGFSLMDYKDTAFSFRLPKLALGVYHISADIYYGDKVISNHTSAIEVMDESSSVSPQIASGIPSMHLGDAGPNLVYTGGTNFYTEKPEYNFNHYITRGLYPPITGEEMRAWELAHFYKREFFIWTTIRTVKDYDISKLPGVMANADHIHPPVPGFEDVPMTTPHRYDCFRYGSYGKNLRGWVNDFLSEHPDYKEATGIKDALKEFTKEQHIKFMGLCGTEWVDFILPRIRKLMKAQNEEIRKQNPNFRRSGYGPWSAYNCPYFGAYGAKWFGYDVTKHHEVFGGFMQLEDYPYSCAYHTTLCSWAVMTIKLLNSRVTVYPELYFVLPSGGPDLACTCAYPPFGESSCPLYFTPTQICEYVYGTAHYKNGKFDYWRDNGFAPFQFLDNFEARFRAILTSWKKMLDNKPVRPLKSTAFVYDINSKEDRFQLDIKDGNFYNISETNLSYVYDLMKSNGIPGGFGTQFSDIVNLTEKDVSAVVLPDMTNAPKDAIKKLRELHKKGVTLIAVSRVGELSDLFGVKENLIKKDVNTLYANGEEEYIFPNNAEFFHENVSGEVLLTANEGIPVVIKGDNTILLNTAIGQVGIDSLHTIDTNGRTNISKLMRSVLKDAVQNTVSSIAESDDNTGITLHKTEKGETLLVLTDYSEYSQEGKETPARKEIRFNIPVADIEHIDICSSNIDLIRLYDGEVLKGISVMIKPQETLLFKLR